MFIETSDEQDFLESAATAQSPDRNYWLGIEQNANGTQVWMDGSEITYEKYGVMDDGGECFRMKHASSFEWHDRDCSTNEGYMCERSSGKSFTHFGNL